MKGLLSDIYKDRLDELNQEVARVKNIKTMKSDLDILMAGIAREIVSSKTIVTEIKGERSPVTFKNLITVMCIDDNGVSRPRDFKETEEYKQLVELYKRYKQEVDAKIAIVKQDLLESCKVFELSESRLYCSNMHQEGAFVSLDPKQSIVCPEVLIFTQDRQGIWILESVSCITEVQKRNLECMLKGEDRKVYNFPLIKGIVTESTFLMLDEN